MFNMAPENDLFRAAQGRLHRSQLGQDINAIPLIFHHAHQAGHLTVNTLEAWKLGGVTGIRHGLYHTPLWYAIQLSMITWPTFVSAGNLM